MYEGDMRSSGDVSGHGGEVMKERVETELQARRTSQEGSPMMRGGRDHW